MEPAAFLKIKNNFSQTVLTISILFFCFIFIPGAMAVLPPEHYHRQAVESKIKAVAYVEKITIIERTFRHSLKQVKFKLEKAYSKAIPDPFLGTCYSVDHFWQSPGESGMIYYYPQVDMRVLVTVSENNGSITSFTEISKLLEKELEENGLKNISFSMGKASIRSGQQ